MTKMINNFPEQETIPKISVTGTKGKTTTVAIIADVLQALGNNVLKVDTTGHFINGERKSTLEDSRRTWQLVPSVCPGRYLWEFYANPALASNGIAILECSLGCSAISGVGYRYHNVGVFLNVFEDHLGSSERIQTQQDIADAKEFIFSRIHPNGWAVINADDALVCNKLTVIKSDKMHYIPIGFDFSHYDIDAHLQAGGVALTVRNKKVILLSSGGDKELFDAAVIPWTFDATFIPSLWNLLSAAAAVYAHYNGNIDFKKIKKAFEAVRLDKYGGRLTVLRATNGAKIIADYAHEKVSLVQVAKLAKSITPKGGSVIGVVRLAHDRTDSLMQETGIAVGKVYDKLVVYEKIDGYWRQPVNQYKKKFPQVIGRTSEIFAEAIASVNSETTRIMREDEALQFAASIAGPDDTVVVIVNDNIEQSIGFIQDAFKADFV